MTKKNKKIRNQTSLDAFNDDSFDEENIEDEVTNTNMGPIFNTSNDKEASNEINQLNNQNDDLKADRMFNISQKNKKVIFFVVCLLSLVSGVSFNLFNKPKNNTNISTKEEPYEQYKNETQNEDIGKYPLLQVLFAAAVMQDENNESSPKAEKKKTNTKKHNTKHKKRIYKSKVKSKRKVLWQSEDFNDAFHINNKINNAVLLTTIYSNRTYNHIKVRLYGDSVVHGITYPENTIFLAKYDGRLINGRLDLEFYKALLPNNKKIDIKAYALSDSQRGIKIENQYTSKVGNRSRKTLFRAAKSAISYGSGGLGQQIISDVGRDTLDEVDDSTTIEQRVLVKKGVNLTIQFNERRDR